MNRFLIKYFLTFPLIFFGLVPGQNETFEVVGTYQFPTEPTNCSGIWPPEFGASDMWGWTGPDGSEYALVGTNFGFSVLSVPDMELLTEVKGPQMNPSICRYFPRDIKTIGHYAYMTTDGQEGENSGVMIFDLSGLPESVRLVQAYRPGSANKINSHNHSIDTTSKYAYILGGGWGGFRIVDIADPENPVEGIEVNTGGIHDVTALDDLVYVAGGSDWYSIWDVSNKTAPVQLTKFSSNVTYSHTIWPTDDRNFVITTDETANKDVLFWDLDRENNYANPSIVARWLGQSKMGHNLIIKGKYAFISHYASGVYVLDISDFTNPVEVAHIDTHFSENPALDEQPGLWGAFGLYISNSNYVMTCNMDDGVVTVMKWDDGTTPVIPFLGPSVLPRSALYPNPVTSSATIPFYNKAAGNIILEVRNSGGKLVTYPVTQNFNAGNQTFSFTPAARAGNLARGRYHITLKSQDGLSSLLSTSFDYIGP